MERPILILAIRPPKAESSHSAAEPGGFGKPTSNLNYLITCNWFITLYTYHQIHHSHFHIESRGHGAVWGVVRGAVSRRCGH